MILDLNRNRKDVWVTREIAALAGIASFALASPASAQAPPYDDPAVAICEFQIKRIGMRSDDSTTLPSRSSRSHLNQS